MAVRLGAGATKDTDRFSRVGRSSDTHRTTVRLPAGTRQEMMQAMASASYGLRQKSDWVCDAAREFLADETWTRLKLSDDAWKRLVVDTECVRAAKNVVETVQVPDDLRIRLWRASIDAALWGAEQDDPVYLEISVASVIRSAILWKLGMMGP
jgi:hypothetical protein